MKRILCWLGIHDWGRQYNIRGGCDSNIVLLAMLFHHPRCDRKCVRCGKVKTFSYNSEYGK